MKYLLSSQHKGTIAPIKVMVIDDCLLARGLIANALESVPHIKVISSVHNGEGALRLIHNEDPDVITLDLDMPGMGGIKVLPKLRAEKPNCRIVVVSSMDFENTAFGPAVLRNVRASFVQKPAVLRDICSADDFVMSLIKAVCGGLPKPNYNSAPVNKGPVGLSALPLPPPLSVQSEITIRKASSTRPQIVAISSSTGGPPVLKKLLQNLNQSINVPVLITQHIQPKITGLLANSLNDNTQWACHVARDGDLLQSGHVYIAPGDRHMLVKKYDGAFYASLNDDEPENYCRPSADPMLRSLVNCFGAAVLSVILTGMGHDGRNGSKLVVEHGGTVVAQNEETSVIWGMPGAVAMAGLCCAVLPLQDIAPKIERLLHVPQTRLTSEQIHHVNEFIV